MFTKGGQKADTRICRKAAATWLLHMLWVMVLWNPAMIYVRDNLPLGDFLVGLHFSFVLVSDIFLIVLLAVGVLKPLSPA